MYCFQHTLKNRLYIIYRVNLFLDMEQTPEDIEFLRRIAEGEERVRRVEFPIAYNKLSTGLKNLGMLLQRGSTAKIISELSISLILEGKAKATIYKKRPNIYINQQIQSLT